MSKHERTVGFVNVDESQARDVVRQQTQEGGIVAAVPQFTVVRDLPSFHAEWALQGQDIVIHFFLPPGYPQDYWTVRFPRSLDPVARAHFGAERPRLQAKYTGDLGLNSWWLRANGYGHIIDLSGFVRKFFETLDASLRTPQA